jgi:hypothetical protein
MDRYMSYGHNELSDAQAQVLAETLLNKWGPAYYNKWKRLTLALMELEQKMGKEMGLKDHKTVMTAFYALLDAELKEKYKEVADGNNGQSGGGNPENFGQNPESGSQELP